MKKTDYSKIAERYDNNELRHNIPEDPLVEKLYELNKQNIKILDLACGTGNYLQKQLEYYRGYNIRWFGIDLSEEMLKKAKVKKLKAELIKGDALNLPFEDNFFDYIKLRFAYHHFADKTRAIDEIYRVLKTGGILSIVNLSHDYMNNSWVYRYFPGAIKIDKERFPSSEELYSKLDDRGFDVKAEINVTIKQFSYKEILKEANNRDMSQLSLISESEYEKGLNKIESDSKKNDSFTGDFALLNFTCTKK